MKNKSIKLIVLLTFLILFSAFLYNYLTMKLWDYDFWWHISTGRYIVTERHLPEEDPFSFTSTMEENKNIFPERENFFLKQYWLAQVLFYLIFKYTGPTGIIFMRASILFMTVLIVFWQLKRSGVKFHISFIFVFALFMMTMKSLGERPVLFSILFTSIVLFLLEDFRDRKNKTLFFIVPVMLLWSNMHGGFILGIIIILVFILGEVIKVFLRKSNFTKREMKIFYGATGLAIIASFMNPSGWDSFFMAFSSKYNIFQEGIQEYMSPIQFFIYKIRPFSYAYFSIAAMFPLILILRNRKLELIHVILLTGFFIMSMKASRYGIFYAVAASMIIGKEFDIFIKNLIDRRFSEDFQKKVSYTLTFLALFSSLLFLFGSLKYNIKLGIAKSLSVPVAAVDFIEKNKIQGNMFNDYGYGGYITWRLYPIKNFIDTRSLNRAVMNEYGMITDAKEKVKGIKTTNEKLPLWAVILKHYKINFIFLSITDIYGNVTPLILELAESNKWVPVYYDHMSIIFVKDTNCNKEIISKFKVPKDDVYDLLIAKSASSALYDGVNPRPLISLGYIFSKIGRTEDALKAYKYAAEIWNDPDLMKKIKEIDEEFAKQKKSNNKSLIKDKGNNY